jgi:hypothetical protein
MKFEVERSPLREGAAGFLLLETSYFFGRDSGGTNPEMR